MRKTQKELEKLLEEFTQKHGDQLLVFKKIEETYFINKKQNFLKILQEYKPENIQTREFNKAYQYWRRLNELKNSEYQKKCSFLQKARTVRDCTKNHIRNLLELGNGDLELGKEYYEKIMFG